MLECNIWARRKIINCYLHFHNIFVELVYALYCPRNFCNYRYALVDFKDGLEINVFDWQPHVLHGSSLNHVKLTLTSGVVLIL